MTDHRREQIEQIYLDALDIPGIDRPAFLDRACEGDRALRGEVEALLALQSGAEAFLEQPAIESAARTLADILPALRPPEIPGYRIIRHLGEGGMGLVYLAEQQAPLHRLVALKVIRPGMDSRQIVARFNAERQAIAQMDHPNIAAVHDAGATADGRPFFVMEFVDGLAISEYCDRKGLPTVARLELFTQVCAAVQHAHQKGVIHRDLKPSNVLVAEQDGRPMPKVIDFGTAKAIEPAGEGATVTLTSLGMVLGTIEYMSPEQAAFSRDIDTTTDVYSLGVMLYELLVGVLPFERPRPGPEGYDDLRRMIREIDPPRPSTRLSAIADGRAGIASARQTDPDRLKRSLQGDLDWITLKALEKERPRRYPTVAAFASDIRRFLSDQPIDARPPSAGYRIRKFTRRNSGAVTAAVSLFVVLLAGLAVSLTQYFRAEQALIEATNLRIQAESQGASADTARADAVGATTEAIIQRLYAERQGLVATQEAERAVVARDVSDYLKYVMTIAAADAEVRASELSEARARLNTVPDAWRGWEWGHLFLRAESSLRTLADTVPCPPSSPAFAVNALVKDPDGKRIYFSHCQHVNSWDTETLEPTVAVSSPNVIVAAAASGRRVEYVLASDKATPHPEKKWNVYVADSIGVQSPRLIGTVDREPACADLSRDGRILALGLRPQSTGGPFNTVIESDLFELWDVENARRIRRVVHPEPPNPDSRPAERNCFVRLSPDTTLLATSGAVVRVWVAATGQLVHADLGQAGLLPQAIAFGPTNRQLAIGRRNGLIDILDVVNSIGTLKPLDGADIVRPRPLREGDRLSDVLNRSHEEVRAIDFAQDGRTLVSALANRVIVWDLQSARVRKVLDAHQSPVTGLVVHEHLVYSARADATVEVTDLEGSSGVTRLAGSTGRLFGVVMSADGRTVAGSAYSSLTVWHPDQPREPVVLQPESRTDTGFFSLVVPLADNRTILTGLGPLGSLRRWDSETRQSVSLPTMDRLEPGCEAEGLAHAAVSPNDRYLALLLGNCVVVRDLYTTETLAILPVDRPGFHESSGAYVGFLSDESILVTALVGARLPDASPSARFNSVRRWDWRTKHITADGLFPLPTAIPFAVAVSKDGRRIALGDGGVVTVWDGALAREIGRIRIPANLPMALSPDGSRLAVATFDQTVRVWDTAKSQLLLTLTDDDDVPKFLAFTPSGQLIAVNASGGLTIWETQRPKPKGAASGK